VWFADLNGDGDGRAGCLDLVAAMLTAVDGSILASIDVQNEITRIPP
jgi:hypothetical protein